MHEAALSRAALPAPTTVLGLRLRPFSLGHLLWLTRECVIESLANDLPAAVLICSQTWKELRANSCNSCLPDPLLSLKMWLWRRAMLGAEKAHRRSHSCDTAAHRNTYYKEQL